MVKENFYRNRSKTNLQNMYNNKPKRNAYGEIVRPALFQSRTSKVAVIPPNFKLFTSTRSINMNEIVREKEKSTYEVLLKKGQIPFSILAEKKGKKKIKYDDIHKSKRAKLNGLILINKQEVKINKFDGDYCKSQDIAISTNISEIIKRGQILQKFDSKEKSDTFDSCGIIERSDTLKNTHIPNTGQNDTINLSETPRLSNSHGSTDFLTNKEYNGEHDILKPGKSRRIWGELYKVLDTSDVIIHVLDARYPRLFLSQQILNYIKEKEYKNLILVLNKVDLIPANITQKNIELFSNHFPTIAMHSKSLHNFYGKLDLMNLLRQYRKIHKKTISVGFVGYPNVGKSSIINILTNKKSTKTAPLAGETKTWQHVKLDKRINLFDCPGIIDEKDKSLSETDLGFSTVLMGAVRVEKIKNPEDYVLDLIKIAKSGLEKKYKTIITEPYQFIDDLSRKTGKLLKNGEPNIHLTSKMILNDWVQGKIPFWVEPKPFKIE